MQLILMVKIMYKSVDLDINLFRNQMNILLNIDMLLPFILN